MFQYKKGRYYSQYLYQGYLLHLHQSHSISLNLTQHICSLISKPFCPIGDINDTAVGKSQFFEYPLHHTVITMRIYPNVVTLRETHHRKQASAIPFSLPDDAIRCTVP